MASLIAGYENDIFISYRQKDNKHDGWVTEFVNQLKGQIEATFKEDISIYFDENPSDGLLETHSVDKSLEGKLKCLIFIPIISQTYCDPKSFAWQFEFCAFNRLAKVDMFGRDIKLTGGNVASRILPIKIHDIDSEDKTLLENEIEGVLRPIEFIYKSAGVNRPLNPTDNPDRNVNKTFYRDQVNKVANAVKEIITALKKQNQNPGGKIIKDFQPERRPVKRLKAIILPASVFALTILVLVYFFLPGLFKSSPPSDKTIAVLPFVNDSPDKENDYFCNGMVEEILNNLQKIGELKVKSRTSVERFRTQDHDIRAIGRELEVSFILEGSVRKHGDNLRIAAQLIDAKTGDHLWSEIYDGKYTDQIFVFQSTVAKKVAGSLQAVISPAEKESIEILPTTQMLAHDLQLRGHEMIRKWRYTRDSTYLNLAFNLLNEALKIDSGYLRALSNKIMLFSEISNFDSALYYINRIQEIDPGNEGIYGQRGGIYYYSNQPDSALKYYAIAERLSPDSYWINLSLAQTHCFLKNDIIRSLPYFQKAIVLGGDKEPEINSNISSAFLLFDYYPKAMKYAKYALNLRPECSVIQRNDCNFFVQGKYNEALVFLDSICNLTPCERECDLMRFYIYSSTREFEKAEKYYDKIEGSGYRQGAWDRIFLGYLYNETGRKQKAETILLSSIKDDEKALTENPTTLVISQINIRLAAAWAVLNDRDKAMNYLHEVEKVVPFEWPVKISLFPGFDRIRDDPEFMLILKNIEDKKAILRSKVQEMEKAGELNL